MQSFVPGFLCWIFIALCRFSLVAVNRDYSLVAVYRLLIEVASVLWSMGSRACRLQQLQHVGLVIVVHGLSCSVACGILVPRLGIEKMCPALAGRFFYFFIYLSVPSPSTSMQTLGCSMWDLIPRPTSFRGQNLNQWTTREVPAGRFLITVVPGKSSCCFDYGSFVVQLEVMKYDTSTSVPLSQDCFSYLGSFVVPYKFQYFLFQFCEKYHGYLDRNCIESIDCTEQYGRFDNINSSNP